MALVLKVLPEIFIPPLSFCEGSTGSTFLINVISDGNFRQLSFTVAAFLELAKFQDRKGITVGPPQPYHGAHILPSLTPFKGSLKKGCVLGGWARED